MQDAGVYLWPQNKVEVAARAIMGVLVVSYLGRSERCAMEVCLLAWIAATLSPLFSVQAGPQFTTLTPCPNWEEG